MIIIVGASGFIGHKIYSFFQSKKKDLKGVFHTRTTGIKAEDMVFADLENGVFDKIESIHEIEFVVLSHGISNIEQCKKNAALTYKVNVENTIRLLEIIKDKGAVPVYFSTNMVYDGYITGPDESVPPNPINEYGRQKLLVEKFIKGNFKRYIILRLTKVFGVQRGDSTIFTSWIERLEFGEKLKVLHDIFISPVFVGDVVRFINALMEGGYSGIFHLGGAEIGSFANFAKRLAVYFKYDDNRIYPISISELNLAERRPKFNTLNSGKLLKTTGFVLTTYEDCFKLISENFASTAELKGYSR